MQPPSQINEDAEPHRVVAIGASAGGVETLRRVVGGLPPDLAATVCVVLHLAPGSPSALPSILQRVSSLRCRSAVDGEILCNGEILVAPPDRHLTISDGRVSLTVGPRENGHRPAVDVLFRTAAEAQDGKVIGVVLSGTRDDGTAGLAMIKAHGGTAIVQDPEEAMYPGMPASALAHVAVDAVLPSDQIAAMIVRLVHGEPAPVLPAAADPVPADNPGHSFSGAVGHSSDSTVGGDDPDPAGNPNPVGNPAPLGNPASLGKPGPVGNPGAGAGAEPSPVGPVSSTCPECGGVLDEYTEAGITQWRCRVGHRYSPESLADAQAEGVEGALWAAIRALDDRRALLLRIADQLQQRDRVQSADSFRRRAGEAARQANAIRGALRDAATTSLQKVSDSEAVEAERRSTGRPGGVHVATAETEEAG